VTHTMSALTTATRWRRHRQTSSSSNTLIITQTTQQDRLKAEHVS